MGKGSSGGTNTVVQNSQPPSQVMAAYTDLMNRAQGAANTPYQPYLGPSMAYRQPGQFGTPAPQPDPSINPFFSPTGDGKDVSGVAGLAPDASGVGSAPAGTPLPFTHGPFGSPDNAPPDTPAGLTYGNIAQGLVANPSQYQLLAEQMALNNPGGQYLGPAGLASDTAFGRSAQALNQGQNALQQIGAFGTNSGQNIASYGTNAGRGISDYAYGIGAAGPQFANINQIGQYLSPYNQNVIDTTLANINQQNDIQQQGVVGNAIRAGNAFGGDRMGLAQADLARNQDLAKNQTIAGLENQNYAQALGQLNTTNTQALAGHQAALAGQQAGAGLGLGAMGTGTQYGLAGLEGGNQLGLTGTQLGMSGAAQAAGLYGNLGQLANAQNLQQQQSLYAAGGQDQGQQQALLNAAYQQYQQGVGYPYQQTAWLGNLVEGTAGLLGGQSSTTSPGPSALSQIGGGLLGGIGMLGRMGGMGGMFGGGGASGGGFASGMGGLGGADAGMGLAGLGALGADAGAASLFAAPSSLAFAALANRGGRVKGYDQGGSINGDDLAQHNALAARSAQADRSNDELEHELEHPMARGGYAGGGGVDLGGMDPLSFYMMLQQQKQGNPQQQQQSGQPSGVAPTTGQGAAIPGLAASVPGLVPQAQPNYYRPGVGIPHAPNAYQDPAVQNIQRNIADATSFLKGLDSSKSGSARPNGVSPNTDASGNWNNPDTGNTTVPDFDPTAGTGATFRRGGFAPRGYDDGGTVDAVPDKDGVFSVPDFDKEFTAAQGVSPGALSQDALLASKIAKSAPNAPEGEKAPTPLPPSRPFTAPGGAYAGVAPEADAGKIPRLNSPVADVPQGVASTANLPPLSSAPPTRPHTIDRTPFQTELQRNPALAKRLADMVNGEVGLGKDPVLERIQLESAFNRAQARGIPLSQALLSVAQDPKAGYYASDTYSRPASPGQLDYFQKNVLGPVLAGSDEGTKKFGFLVTGNASGLDFAGRRAQNGTYANSDWYTGKPGNGEMYVTEKADAGSPLAQGRTTPARNTLAFNENQGVGGDGNTDIYRQALKSLMAPAQPRQIESQVPKPDIWQAMMAAGFGMMAGQSPHAGVNIGQGALMGMQNWSQQQSQARQNFDSDRQASALADKADHERKQMALTLMSQMQKQQHDESTLAEQKRQHNMALRSPVGLGVYDPQTFAERKAMPVPNEQGGLDFFPIMPDGTLSQTPLRPGVSPLVGGNPGQTAPSSQSGAPGKGGFQSIGFNPDLGTYRAVSKLAENNGTFDYAQPDQPVIEQGAPLPKPKPVGNYSTPSIESAAEMYLETGRLPTISRGGSPVARQQLAYQQAVQNYGNALAASRGLTPEDMVGMQRSAPGMLRFVLGADGRSTVALGTAVRHLDTLKEYAKAWADWHNNPTADNVQALNRVRSFVATQFGSDAATNLQTVSRIVGPEIIKAIGVAGGGTEKDRSEAASAFTTANSIEQVLGATQATQKLLGGQLQGKKQQAALAGVNEPMFRRLVGERPYEILSNIDSAGKAGAAAPSAQPAQAKRVIQNGWVYEQQSDGNYKAVSKAP